MVGILEFQLLDQLAIGRRSQHLNSAHAVMAGSSPAMTNKVGRLSNVTAIAIVASPRNSPTGETPNVLRANHLSRRSLRSDDHAQSSRQAQRLHRHDDDRAHRRL